jgi:hypothetical protein
MVREVDQSQFADAHAHGHLVVDVREGSKYAGGTRGWIESGRPVATGSAPA